MSFLVGQKNFQKVTNKRKILPTTKNPPLPPTKTRTLSSAQNPKLLGKKNGMRVPTQLLYIGIISYQPWKFQDSGRSWTNHPVFQMDMSPTAGKGIHGRFGGTLVTLLEWSSASGLTGGECCDMGFQPKNRGFLAHKMDGENNGKPFEQMDDLGFRKHPYEFWAPRGPSRVK